MTRPPRRGDGVGVELTRSSLRGIRLDHDEPERITAVADVPIVVPGDERSMVDAFVRLRAELGNPDAPTRIAMFPPATSMQRVDATGRSGPELNALRAELEDRFDITTTMLLDDGPRRWLATLAWDPQPVRDHERIAERARFADIAIEPSPVALGRVIGADATWVRRDADDAEAFTAVVDGGVPVAAVAGGTIGRIRPGLEVRRAPISIGLFDDHLDAGELAALVARISGDVGSSGPATSQLVVGGRAYPDYPAHDIRSAERQCVALGAALGAAGLAGRARPVDVVLPVVTDPDAERPWAIERLTELSPAPAPVAVGAVRRIAARVRPRRAGPR